MATELSYAKTTLVREVFWGWSPPFPEADGEVLVSAGDGKAAPTATAAELAKRRGPRRRPPKGCVCPRQRGRAKRRGPQQTRPKRRKKGDQSTNGRRATLVSRYTLRRGTDGKWHGPSHPRVWGSFAARKNRIAWVRAEAPRRGFGPKTARRVQLVVDGETCLAKRMRQLFPKAL
jgi:hypothetical protein